MSSCVVVLSGGQDSATCLHLARVLYDDVVAVSFDYEQRHRAELAAAAEMCAAVAVPHVVLPATALSVLGGNALTDAGIPVTGTAEGGLPSTFVPFRNVVFLTLAAAVGVKGAAPGRPVHVITGVCETDFSGYPDCRRSTMDALEAALTLAVDRPVRIVTPLMYVNKAETCLLARRLGPAALHAMALSVTCYEGKRPGCGACPACILRARGFADAGFPDPANG